MDWPSLLVGAGVGGVVGILLQNLLFPPLERRWRIRRQRRFYARWNRVWERFERIHPRLMLVQAGWADDGCFSEGSIVLRLDGLFTLNNPATRRLRQAHSSRWAEDGFTDDEQVGIKAISIARISDDPTAEREGRAHRLFITAHRYRYYDMLTTHVLRLRGTPAEKATLDAIVGTPTPDHPVAGFPTPCSVGLSVFCEDGATLLLVRRSRRVGTGGYWEPGSVFNAVGENATLTDFTSANRHANESSPSVVARRGLYQELGLSDADISAADVRLHSFAWASDLLDFKFFGYMITPLSYSAVQSRWREAADRSETTGAELIRWPVQSPAVCWQVLTAIRNNPEQWAPEAIFATVRSLVTLRRITVDDVIHLMPSAIRNEN